MAISFSRAAVGALERRIGREGGMRVAIRTLDSLAARILDEADDQDWRTLSFDQRIASGSQIRGGRTANCPTCPTFVT